MTTGTTLQARIVVLESSARIAVEHGDLVFAQELRIEAEYLAGLLAQQAVAA